MDLPSTPNKFNSGEFLTAAKLNKIVEWIKAAEREIRANEIKPGAGLTFTRTAAGTSISAVHRFIPETDDDDTGYPFRVSLTYVPPDDDSQLGGNILHCRGGFWYGNGAGAPRSGTFYDENGNIFGRSGNQPSAKCPDTFWIPPSYLDVRTEGGEAAIGSISGDSAALTFGNVFAVVLYAEADADTGTVKTQPGLYFIDLGESSEWQGDNARQLFELIDTYRLSTFYIVGIWKLSGDDETDISTYRLAGAPGQIIRQHIVHASQNIFSRGAFGLRLVDGYRARLHINAGYALVRVPGRMFGLYCNGDALVLDETTETLDETSETVGVLTDVDVGVQFVYPDEEIKFIESATLYTPSDEEYAEDSENYANGDTATNPAQEMTLRMEVPTGVELTPQTKTANILDENDNFFEPEFRTYNSELVAFCGWYTCSTGIEALSVTDGFPVRVYSAETSSRDFHAADRLYTSDEYCFCGMIFAPAIYAISLGCYTNTETGGTLNISNLQEILNKYSWTIPQLSVVELTYANKTHIGRMLMPKDDNCTPLGSEITYLTDVTAELLYETTEFTLSFPAQKLSTVESSVAVPTGVDVTATKTKTELNLGEIIESLGITPRIYELSSFASNRTAGINGQKYITGCCPPEVYPEENNTGENYAGARLYTTGATEIDVLDEDGIVNGALVFLKASANAITEEPSFEFVAFPAGTSLSEGAKLDEISIPLRLRIQGTIGTTCDGNNAPAFGVVAAIDATAATAWQTFTPIAAITGDESTSELYVNPLLHGGVATVAPTFTLAVNTDETRDTGTDLTGTDAGADKTDWPKSDPWSETELDVDEDALTTYTTSAAENAVTFYAPALAIIAAARRTAAIKYRRARRLELARLMRAGKIAPRFDLEREDIDAALNWTPNAA